MKQKLKNHSLLTFYIISILILTTCLCNHSLAALIPPSYSDCVVAIGVDPQNQPFFTITEVTLKNLKSETIPEIALQELETLKNKEFIGQEQFLNALKTTIGEEATSKYQSIILKYARSHKWTASGFLYGHFLSKKNEKENTYSTYLVTNRHVLIGSSQIFLRVNPIANEPAREYPVPLISEKGIPIWFAHPNPNIDIAVIPLNVTLLKEQKMQVSYFQSDQNIANIEKMKEIEVSEGDFAYVLGFPMALVGELRNTVIVRSGSIARIRDALARASYTFLTDTFIFPGNSGGPVILKPEMISIQGTKSSDTAYLIGIVSGYLPYRDVAFSQQTQEARILFEENSGLAIVYPTDYIEEVIQLTLNQPHK